MSYIKLLQEKIIAGGAISKKDALYLLEVPLQELTAAADSIRFAMCGNDFDICTIVNGKCGRCSEDCKFCAQSSHYHTACSDNYPLLSTEELLQEAVYNVARGVLRYSIVTSGKALSDTEVEQICESIRILKNETPVEICISFGLLQENAFRRLKEAGVSRVHCNLETSERFFKNICTTHTFAEKVASLKAASRVGLSVCSGGILGLGETNEDRIDMILTARELGIKSIPLNLLNPIPGTPYANNTPLTKEEACRFVAISRFLIPDGFIRLAGGRGILDDKGKSCFQSGANAAISGDMLTTSGITIETDLSLLKELGYQTTL